MCVDGPAGSGKTTLARRVAELVPDARLLHVDDLLEGWRGAAGGWPAQHRRAAPARWPADETGRCRRWDWYADGWARLAARSRRAGCWCSTASAVGSPEPTPTVTTVLVWVEAPDDVRLERWLGPRRRRVLAPTRSAWLRDEAAQHDGDRTRERADLLVDADGRLLSPPSGLSSSRSSRTARRARAPSEPWMPIAGRLSPSARSSVDPRRARRQVDRDDLRPLVLAAAVAVDDDQPVGVRPTRERASAKPAAKTSSPRTTSGAALEEREPVPGLVVEA